MPLLSLSLFNQSLTAGTPTPNTSAQSPPASQSTTQRKTHSPLFGSVALTEVDALKAQIAESRGKAACSDYIDAAIHYLVPYFGQRPIDELTPEVIEAFGSWRASRLGRLPKQSTQRNHASAFARVVNSLRCEGLWDERRPLSQRNVGGPRGEPRLAFTNEEVERPLVFVPLWVHQGRHRDADVMRRFCWAYVKFLLYMGMRAGTETLNMRWLHLQWHDSGAERLRKTWV